MAEQPQGTVTLVFTDIEGSTRLLDELGPEAYREALAEHRRIVREAFGRFSGYEVDYEGDAFFYAFASAQDAVSAVSEAMAGLEPGPISIRVGVHTGEPIPDPPKYVGMDVHTAARIMSSGHGGQVLVSSSTRPLVDLELRDLGEHRLKDLEQPVSLYQLGTGSFPPLKTISNTNLPLPASSFVGRERETEDVVSLVRKGARIVTLSGPGGTGKTRLAIEAATTLVPDFTNGVFWVGLAALRDPALVIEHVAQVLGATDGLAIHIARRELLLLLDNLEQVVDSAPQLADLLEACPHLQLLVTSRELLRVRSEVEYPVPPLEEREAVELFCQRSRLEPDDTVAELCRRLDDLPLAVELAAARTSVLSPKQILDRLSQRLDLLKGGRDAEARQQTLRATIEWSYELLAPEEQQLFRNLSVVSGGCTLDAAEGVAEADLDTLQSLVEKSLVRFTNERYWQLETIRAYAAEQLEASGRTNEVKRRHAEWFLTLAEELEPPPIGGVGEDWVARLAPETANLRAAIEFFTQCADPTQELRLLGSLFRFWHMVGFLDEGLALAEKALERAPDNSPLRVKVLYTAAICDAYLRDFVALERVESERLRIARKLGDDVSAAVALNDLGLAAQWLGDLERARSLFEESASLAESIGDDRVFLAAKGNLAHAERIFGDPGASRDALEALLPAVERLGDASTQAYAVSNLGHALLELGDRPSAAERYRQTIAGSVCPPDMLLESIEGLAVVAHEEGDGIRAATLAGAVRSIRTERGFESSDLDTHIERAETDGRAAIGDEAWEAAFAKGAQMTLDETIAYALETADAP